MKYVRIDGKNYLWREVLQARRDQRKAERQHQRTLFELRHDVRPDTRIETRYQEPSLFDL